MSSRASRSGSKRADPSPIPAGEQQASSRRKTTHGSLSEAHLDGTAEESAVKKLSTDASFWSQWHSQLLFAWLSDFDDHPALDFALLAEEKRPNLINLLITAGASRPATKKALAELQAMWKKHFPKQRGPPPGKHQPSAMAHDLSGGSTSDADMEGGEEGQEALDGQHKKPRQEAPR